jgi:hypothetical protein
MERHHDMQLSQAMDELYLNGTVSIRWDELYLWFKAERLNKRAYAEIVTRWQDLCASQGHSEVPEVTTLNWVGKGSLTLMRKAFEDEEMVPLTDWA